MAANCIEGFNKQQTRHNIIELIMRVVLWLIHFVIAQVDECHIKYFSCLINILLMFLFQFFLAGCIGWYSICLILQVLLYLFYFFSSGNALGQNCLFVCHFSSFDDFILNWLLLRFYSGILDYFYWTLEI